MKKPTLLLTFLYAAVVIMLGIMGYQAGSAISLIISLSIGLLISVLLLASIYLHKSWPIFLVLINVIALLSFFIYRFSSTKTFMPAAMSLFSGLVAALITILLASKKKI